MITMCRGQGLRLDEGRNSSHVIRDNAPVASSIAVGDAQLEQRIHTACRCLLDGRASGEAGR